MSHPPPSENKPPASSLDQTRTEAEALMAMLRGQSGTPSLEEATRRLPPPSPEEPSEKPPPDAP